MQCMQQLSLHCHLQDGWWSYKYPLNYNEVPRCSSYKINVLHGNVCLFLHIETYEFPLCLGAKDRLNRKYKSTNTIESPNG